MDGIAGAVQRIQVHAPLQGLILFCQGPEHVSCAYHCLHSVLRIIFCAELVFECPVHGHVFATRVTVGCSDGKGFCKRETQQNPRQVGAEAYSGMAFRLCQPENHRIQTAGALRAFWANRGAVQPKQAYLLLHGPATSAGGERSCSWAGLLGGSRRVKCNGPQTVSDMRTLVGRLLILSLLSSECAFGTPTTGHRFRTNGTRRNQHSPGTPTTALRERGNNTSRSTGRSSRQNAATRRNMRREERVTVQGPVKKQQPNGMSHTGGGP